MKLKEVKHTINLSSSFFPLDESTAMVAFLKYFCDRGLATDIDLVFSTFLHGRSKRWRDMHMSDGWAQPRFRILI